MGKQFCFLATLLAVHIAGHAGEVIDGRVVGVSDGDTMTVLAGDRRQVKIRLDEVDAPEKAQPFGQASKRSLSDLCFGKSARVAVKKTDRYGRSVAAVSCEGVDAGSHQVRAGMAWAYRQYLKDKRLLDHEATARRGRVGLWSDECPIAPWEFRRGEAATAGTCGVEPGAMPVIDSVRALLKGRS